MEAHMAVLWQGMLVRLDEERCIARRGREKGRRRGPYGLMRPRPEHPAAGAEVETRRAVGEAGESGYGLRICGLHQEDHDAPWSPLRDSNGKGSFAQVANHLDGSRLPLMEPRHVTSLRANDSEVSPRSALSAARAPVRVSNAARSAPSTPITLPTNPTRRMGDVVG